MAEVLETNRTAVVLFNLGGPDSLDAVRPFLFNLFSDPAILTVGQPMRYLLARYISGRRTAAARAIYAQMGGRSPLLENTLAQGQALADVLLPFGDVRVYISMRYWHPRAEDTAAAVKRFDPDRVILLPLYPQFSTTSTGSSLKDWGDAAARVGLDRPTTSICCFPTLPGVVKPMAAETAEMIRRIGDKAPVRVLLSAHGLPERVIRNGDPYRWQVESTAAALIAATEPLVADLPKVDWRVTFQSRATPEKWLKPDTAVEVKRAAKAGCALVVVPIAFTSEHSETLIELDQEYAGIARENGAAAYLRVATVGAAPDFIAGLAELVRRTLLTDGYICSQFNRRICPVSFSGCPNSRK